MKKEKGTTIQKVNFAWWFSKEDLSCTLYFLQIFAVVLQVQPRGVSVQSSLGLENLSF
jgi:hypothetical protein